MKLSTTIKSLTFFEIALWAASVALITGGFLISGRNGLSLLPAFFGVSALIFIAKGQPLGQLLMVFFALFYVCVS